MVSKAPFKFTLLLLLLPFLGLSQTEVYEREVFKGKVLSEVDSNGIEGVHVINLRSLEGTITDTEGNFLIPTNQGDRILFSHLGFELDTVHFTVDHLAQPYHLYMKEVTFMLPIFQVLAIGTFEEFKKEFLALELPENKIQLNLPPPGSYEGKANLGPAGIYIPFDLSSFTRKAKELRKYRELLARDEWNEMIYARYNPKVIEKVTGIKDEEGAEALMEYCNFSDQFIRESIDYDLYVAIIECYKKYSDQ